MSGRTVIVTGASSGLGYEIARYLCEGGNDVILACRNKEKTEAAIEKIKRANPSAMATHMELDLSSKESIDKFVADFRASERKLHVIVNNAAMMLPSKETNVQVTGDGLEVTMATNHLGPFMLTNMLLEDIKKAAAEENADCRIVMVTGAAQDLDGKRKMNAFDLDDMFCYKEGAFSGQQAYRNSKIASLMFACALSRKLADSGVGVNCVYPGHIPGTELKRSMSTLRDRIIRRVDTFLVKVAKRGSTASQAANTVCQLVSDEKYKGVSGKYFRHGEEAELDDAAKNEEEQEKLWQLSGGYLHMEGFEQLDIPTPPPPKEEPPKKEKKSKKTAEAATAEPEAEAKQEEGAEAAAAEADAKQDEEAPAAAEDENKTDEEKKVDEADEKKDEEKEKEEEKPAEKIEEDEIKLEKEKLQESEKPAAETPAAPEVTA